MPGRVLNFNEFSDKYSNQSAELGLDAVIQSQSNFEDGFDDSTYDQQPIGPNRPVTGAYDSTPNQPSGEFAPDFSDDTMNAPAPEEVEEPTETEEEVEETPIEKEEEDEAEIEDEDESDEDEKAGDDVPEPEAGANPSNESVLMGFSQFVNESRWNEELEPEEEPDPEQEEYEGPGNWTPQSLYDPNVDVEPDGEQEEYDDSVCTECGDDIWYTDQGANCGCNM